MSKIGGGIIKARDGKTKSFIKGKYNGTELYIGLPVEMQKKYKYIFDGVENGKNNYK